MKDAQGLKQEFDWEGETLEAERPEAGDGGGENRREGSELKRCSAADWIGPETC